MIQCFGRILQVPLVIGYRRTSICLVFCSLFHNFYSQCSKQMIPGLLRLANFLWRSQSPISVCCLAGFIAHYCLILDFFAGNLETLSMSSYIERVLEVSLALSFWYFLSRGGHLLYSCSHCTKEKPHCCQLLQNANISQGFHTKRSL